jgi:N-acetylmuramoyl-L-alanine amidase
VRLTRSDDRFVALDARAKFANDRNAAYFVAVHVNSAPMASASGYEDYVHNSGGASTESRRGELHDAVAAYMRRHGVEDRGRKRANFAVLRETDMAAVLTENLFISTRSDAELLADESFLEGLAEAHARGIAKALQLPRVAVPV